MKPQVVQQEILINTETHFAQNYWLERDTDELPGLSSQDKLEKACWDGLIKELIPELDVTLHTTRKLWLWQVHQTQRFLALDFFEYPVEKDSRNSINPYLFLKDLKMS